MGRGDELKVLFLAHGRAGAECASLLRCQLSIASKDIYAVTYNRKENRGLLGALKSLGIAYSTLCIRSKEQMAVVKRFKPDVVVSIYFRDLIPSEIIRLGCFGGFNLHPSLLPQYRGCFSGVWAIINGEKKTGITYHHLTENFDEGKILLQKEIDFSLYETGYSINNRLVDLGVEHFVEAFELVTKEKYPGRIQKGKASYYRRKVPYNGIIAPCWSDEKVDAFIRALYYPGYPGAKVRTRQGLKEVLSYNEYESLKKAGQLLK